MGLVSWYFVGFLSFLFWLGLVSWASFFLLWFLLCLGLFCLGFFVWFFICFGSFENKISTPIAEDIFYNSCFYQARKL